MKEKDVAFEGKSKAYLDVERMTNEGLAGGKVTSNYDHPQIEPSQHLHNETPPKED